MQRHHIAPLFQEEHNRLQGPFSLSSVSMIACFAVPGEQPYRWRSSLVALMKDASGAIERRKDLLGRVEIDTSVRSNSPDLELAAASARRLSIHINAWPPPTLSRELNNTWFVAVTAEANVNPQFKAIVDKWRSVGKQLRQCLSSAREDEKTDARRVEGAMKRVRDCKVRAKIVAKGVKAGRWKRREEGFLRKELKHLESKIAPVSNPAQLAARSVAPKLFSPWKVKVRINESREAHRDIPREILASGFGRNNLHTEYYMRPRGASTHNAFAMSSAQLLPALKG